ncbi:PWWP domain-containing DNA repair factor 4-like [Onychostoma macrolepis]|uniref:PWWP domain-containing DNA repair factor 4-like n=1 Tax=Onychostoma macrolepis TaxID=369639 RepID=UPI00272A99D4|nr:PWWP domain-containing DNA repair factor 4-like [Onychostoma macrolepis]
MCSLSCITCTDEPNRHITCFPCTVCDPAQHLKVHKACTRSADTTCEPQEGFHCIKLNEDSCELAVEHSACKPAQYIKQSYGRRFAFWTDEAKCLLEAKTQPLYRLKRSRSTTQDVPQHVQAVQDRTRTEEALVDCIVTSKGTEQHLVDVLNGKPSKWFPLKPRVPVYMDSEQQCAILFEHLKALLHNCKTQLNFTNEVEFICSFLFPEAIIHGLCELQALSWQEAEEVFLRGPTYHPSEVEEFDRVIAKRMRKEATFTYQKQDDSD